MSVFGKVVSPAESQVLCWVLQRIQKESCRGKKVLHGLVSEHKVLGDEGERKTKPGGAAELAVMTKGEPGRRVVDLADCQVLRTGPGSPQQEECKD